MAKITNIDEKRIQYLQMIQNNISRMSTTSAIFKGFSASIVAGIALISYYQQHTIILILSFVPVIVFALLDSYYLKLERKMRYLYSLVREGEHSVDFSMEIVVEKNNYKHAGIRVVDIVKSPSFFIFYPIMIAWEAFGIKNGTQSIDELYQRIDKYRARNNIASQNPLIGCIILTEPFFFDESDWLPVPDSWSDSIVQGKTYDTSSHDGMNLYQAVIEKISSNKKSSENEHGHFEQYAEYLTKHRLGQGAFRVSVADAYQRRCAITGEKTLPVLEAAHIKPYAEEGPHLVSNGILLKSDFHILFDKGYITIAPNYRIEVSHRLNEDYGNGKEYYIYHGSELLILPDKQEYKPAKEFLDWHNNNVYLG